MARKSSINEVSISNPRQVLELVKRLTLVLLVARTSPEVSDLLGLDVAGGERRTVQRRRRNLQDGKRGSIFGKRLRDSGDAGNQRGEGKTLCQAGQGYQVDN